MKEGITERLQNNNWFNERIKPSIDKAAYSEHSDGFHYQFVKDSNGQILILKVAYSGFIKSVMKLPPEVARELAEFISHPTQ